MENNKIIKVSVDNLLDSLEFLYEKGIDYVDMYINGKELMLKVKEEYYCDEAKEESVKIIINENNINDFIV